MKHPTLAAYTYYAQRALIAYALLENALHRTNTAAALHVSTRQLSNKLREYGWQKVSYSELHQAAAFFTEDLALQVEDTYTKRSTNV